jgi:hypothetical protein
MSTTRERVDTLSHHPNGPVDRPVWTVPIGRSTGDGQAVVDFPAESRLSQASATRAAMPVSAALR